MMTALDSLSDTALLSCLIWGEARGESLEGMIGVAWVVKNRFGKSWQSRDWRSVMLRPKQFSCFNHDDPNLPLILEQWEPLHFTDPTWRLCRWVAHGVIYNWVPDNTGGANHYCVINTNPYWAEGVVPVKVIGSHEFYLL